MGAKFNVSNDIHTEIAELERALKQIRERIAVQAASRQWTEARETIETGPPSVPDESAQHLYRLRRRRDAIFADNADLFGEPAWDILLDLMAAKKEGRDISISSACIGACVAPTTALRYINHLESQGLIIRIVDEFDRRRSYLKLTDSALSKMLQMQEAVLLLRADPAS